MPKHRGIEAYIQVDGKPLEEYGGEVDAENERAYICFVASEAGKAFRIHINSVPEPEYLLDIAPFVDGLRAGSSVSRGSASIEGFAAGHNSYRKFVFTEVTLTDNDNAAQSSDSLGVVELKIFRVVVIGERKTFSRGRFDSLPDDRPLQEKSKKLGGHRIKAGEIIVSSEATRCVDVRSYDPDDPNPYVVFKFMYRPIEILRAQEIAPRLTPSPAPEQVEPSHIRTRNNQRKGKEKASTLSAARKVDNSTSLSLSRTSGAPGQPTRVKREVTEVDGEDDDELTRLEAEIEAKQRKREQLKRKRVKREPSVEIMPEYKLDANGAIDLTAD